MSKSKFGGQRRGGENLTAPPTTPPPGSGNGGGDTPQLQDPQANRQQDPPATGKPVTITAVGNKLIITSDDPETMQLATDIVRLLTKSDGDGDFEVIKLQNASAP